MSAGQPEQIPCHFSQGKTSFPPQQIAPVAGGSSALRAEGYGDFLNLVLRGHIRLPAAGGGRIHLRFGRGNHQAEKRNPGGQIESFYTGQFLAASGAKEAGILMPRCVRRGHSYNQLKGFHWKPGEKLPPIPILMPLKYGMIVRAAAFQAFVIGMKTHHGTFLIPAADPAAFGAFVKSLVFMF